MSSGCRLCERPGPTLFTERFGVPVYQNVLAASPETARLTPRGDLRLVVCSTCGFVSNDAFDSEKLQYGPAYDGDQSHSPHFGCHVDSLIEEVIADGVRGKRVLEIGSGKGYFLTRLCKEGDNIGVGIDSSHTGPEQTADGRVRFVSETYGTGLKHEEADAVVCRHVIEHVPDPLALLRTLRLNIGSRLGVRVYFETPELLWILENLVIQDFFYEHCSYFSGDSLAFAFRRAGFEIVRAVRVFNRQYLWLVAESVDHTTASPQVDCQPLLVALQNYRLREREILLRWAWTLESLRRSGPVAIWGAGAKGVTFVNLLDPRGRMIDCVVDINPRKQGRFVPGAGHPVVSPAALVERGVHQIVLMNPNYETEVRSMLEGLRLEATVYNGSTP